MRKPLAILLLAGIMAQASTAPAINYDLIFEKYAAAYNVSADALKKIAKIESNFNARHEVSVGSGFKTVGIMQIGTFVPVYNSNDPILGKITEEDLRRPDPNIQAAAYMLSRCIAKHGKTKRAVQCYSSCYTERDMSEILDKL